MGHINFKLDDELISLLDEEAEIQGMNKSEFYRLCLETGFDTITDFKTERTNRLIGFYINEKIYKKLLQITRKHKLKIQNTYYNVFETGFDVINKLEFLGFMKIAKGIITVDEIISKYLNRQ